MPLINFLEQLLDRLPPDPPATLGDTSRACERLDKFSTTVLADVASSRLDPATAQAWAANVAEIAGILEC
jgi:hypothetical protein